MARSPTRVTHVATGSSSAPLPFFSARLPIMSSPSSDGSTAAEATPDRPKWRTRLTSDMREELAAAREALGTDNVAELMMATGASRSNVWTWRRLTDAPVKLGRPTFFSPEEEDAVTTNMAAWTKGGDLLTCELAADLLRQHIADLRRDEESERRFGDGGLPLVGLFFICLWRGTRSSVE